MSDSMSAIEYESLEQKYMETKFKLKKTLQYNERYTIQIQKLNKRVKQLENENKQLEHQVNQLQTTARDTSESDVSSPANLHQEHVNMVDLVHSKNQQISDLLKDIEEVENDNVVLRDKLSEAKDQLSTATTEMAAMTETLKVEELRVKEQDEIIKTLKLEIEQMKVQFETIRNEKKVIDENFNKLVKEGKEKEAEWKILLDQKEKEIETLKDSLPKDSAKKSPTTSKKYQDSINESKTPEVDELKIALSEAENQLCVLKSEMENCTIELKQSTKIINKLKGERELLEKKVEEKKHNENEIKEQLKKAHDRCQGMQKEVEYANKLTNLFETDLSTLKDQMKDNGHFEIVDNLEQIQNLKIEKLLHEKQIVGLVKDINKLQEMCNVFEIENVSLRQELGLSLQDTVDIDANIYPESKKQKKLIEKLQTDNKNTQEDKVKLKLENKSLKKQIADLLSECTTENKSETNLENRFSSSQIKDDRSADIKALSQENEALRKGLHEILNSVQVKNETSPRELKSDVLERLLRALDVKHISGWYHPAMRLQAELHTLEGVNTELREQLHEARTELDKFKSIATPRRDQVDSAEQIIAKTDDESREVKTRILENLLSNDVSCLEKIRISVMKLVMYLNETEAEDVESKLENEFEYLKQHIDLLHSNCNNEKLQLLENIKIAEKNIFDLEYEITDTDISPGELTKLVHIEKKKANYSFRQINKLQEELVAIKLNNKMLQNGYLCELETLLKKNTVLQSKINFKEKQCLHSINVEVFKEVQNALNENLKKYRQLLANVEDQKNQRAVEIEILAQRELDLIKENNELKDKLNKTLNKLNQETHKQEQNVLPLSQKLADAEVREISEKHRADHTNNLYELVKEQLKKSEEKFVEFSKYGDGLLQKNLVLQERVAGLEDQLTLWVDPELFKESLENLNSLVKEKEQLITENNELSKKYNELNDSMREAFTWNKEKEQALLGLKHEIIDLTATSDEKTIIDQLYCDLSKSRSELREHQLQVDFLRREISNWESRYAKLYSEMEIQRSHFVVGRKTMDKKIGTLQDIVLKQRILYHGCIPLTIQEILVDKLQTINKEKHEAFISLQNAKTLEGKLQSSQKHNNKAMVDDDYDCRSQQIVYLQQKIQTQDRDLEKLEKELFSAYKIMEFNKPAKDVSAIRKKTPMLIRELVSQESIDPVAISNEPREERRPSTRKESRVVILRNVESQTESQTEKKEDKELTMVKIQLNSLQNQVSIKDNCIVDKERLLLEKTQELAVLQEKLKENQNRITALEHSLRAIQDKEKLGSRVEHDGAAGDGAGVRNNFLDEQVMALRVNLKSAQDRIKQKDLEIIKYQTLLKEDRDKHSLAAANLQQELVILKQALNAEEQNNKSLQQESVISRQKSAAVEKYVSQVRALEKHLAELHTQIAQLKVQLQNAHQEATRWRQMAQDRLVAMQKLGESLNEQHNKELSSYKTDYEKLKELSEEEPTKRGGLEHRMVGYIDPDIIKLCREKDEKITELTVKLKQMQSGETIEKPTSSETISGEEKSNQAREHDILRKKYQSMVNKEKNLKEEMRDLKEQVSKRSNLSARSQKSERTVKEQLQRRISHLEREIESLNDKLLQQQLINEKHKLSANENFEKWKKQKYWQDNCQKYKSESEERKEEIQKLQQTCTGYRMLIERLEREKINLENRIKAFKLEQRSSIPDQEKHLLKEENDRIASQLATLQAKMEIRQQGAGVLGAALMQDKLEAQERKIAILELSSKGTVEVRNELERLQTSMTNLQKNNLCLEAENLELKMDLEKYSKETPHLQQQIQHLESYIQLLKDENQRQLSSANDVLCVAEPGDDKKVSQLERTVFILKRVIEKLQVENKRLVSGKRPLSERSPSAEKLRRDHLRLKEQYTESLQRIKDLESQLQVAKKTQRNQLGIDKTDEIRSQLTEVKEQLLQKTQLLDKVKSLLHTAAAREKQLLKEVAELRCEAVAEKDYHIDIPSPIEEVSEVSSDH